MADEAVRKDEAPRRTYLPAIPEYLTELLNQNQVWMHRDRKTGETLRTSIWDLHLSHLENIIPWLDGQVAYILDVLGIDTEALAAPAMHQWLHQTPLVKALDAALIHKRREAERETPKTLQPADWLLRPMVSLDIETTGIDIENDRMVSFSIGTSTAPAEGEWEAISQIVDPGVEIPEEASNIHGITTERAQAEGIPEASAVKSLVRALHNLHDDVPVIAFNARFDLTILDRAARRIAGEGLHVGYVLDPFVIDKFIDPYRKGKRTLGAVCDHYRVGQRVSHDADEDAQRAMRLVWQEMTSPEAYEYFHGVLPTLQDLQEVQAEEYRNQARDMASWQARTGSVPDVKDDWWPIAKLPKSEMERA